ncbi:MAG: glycine cleavage system protein H, partial [Candidatus Bathyarchaeia archaeon]
MVKVDGYEVPEGLYYTKDFGWIKIEGDKVRVGITDYAQKQLREIVYAELPSPGVTIRQGEPYGTVESVKAVSDLVAPISGTIEEVNEEVQSKPEL